MAALHIGSRARLANRVGFWHWPIQRRGRGRCPAFPLLGVEGFDPGTGALKRFFEQESSRLRKFYSCHFKPSCVAGHHYVQGGDCLRTNFLGYGKMECVARP